MNIPIKNIYYLLSYAWNRMQEVDSVAVDASDYKQLPDLLTKVLLNGCTSLLKQGLERNYIETTNLYQGIKGKLQFNESIRCFAFSHGKTICTYDEYSPDILQNQIIKATLTRLNKLPGLDRELKPQVQKMLFQFDLISEIEPSPYDFSKVNIHRNNRSYDFILKVCQLLLENISLDENMGEYRFKDLLRDQQTMQSLFEDFVRNFYRREQSEFNFVGREKIKWKFIPGNNDSEGYLPLMSTDITLRNEKRKIIIDAKYYKETLATNYNSKKIWSGNLYQIFSYLLNQETGHTKEDNAAGILLYPTIDNEYSFDYLYKNHPIKVRTVDLNQPWKQIENRLLEIISK